MDEETKQKILSHFEIMPCPFCGGVEGSNPKFRIVASEDDWFAPSGCLECVICGCRGPKHVFIIPCQPAIATVQRLVSAWNNRE